MSGADPATQPTAIDLDRQRELRITWGDGQMAALPLALVRRECPCATCRQAREEQAGQPLRVVAAAAGQQDMATAEDAELVGHYALRIRWRDGHNTGIYDFALLRRLAEEHGNLRPAGS